MARLSIRPYRSSDAGAVAAMLHPVFAAGRTYAVDRDLGPEGALAYWTGAGRRVFVAEDADGTPLGTCYLVRNQAGGGAHVANAGFVTAEAATGRGVARAMLTHVEAAARDAGFRAMQFNFVLASNTRAVTTWERAGYAVVGRLPEAFLHPDLGYVDALVMMKPLL